MEKPKSEKQGEIAEAPESRKLNMEEKRKLEKLLIADIDSATARYDVITNEERKALIERLQRAPSAEVKALYARRKLAVKQGEELEEKLDALGYDVTYHGELAVNTSGHDNKAARGIR
jgi:hypothetical protein